jgi:hypothetical protein
MTINFKSAEVLFQQRRGGQIRRLQPETSDGSWMTAVAPITTTLLKASLPPMLMTSNSAQSITVVAADTNGTTSFRLAFKLA